MNELLESDDERNGADVDYLRGYGYEGSGIEDTEYDPDDRSLMDSDDERVHFRRRK
jgi:hypothetical protein